MNEKITYTDFIADDRRLYILKFLKDESDYALSDKILQTALKEIGHGVSRETIKYDLDFLKNLGLVTIENKLEYLVVAKITVKGIDAANGYLSVLGVRKPDP